MSNETTANNLDCSVEEAAISAIDVPISISTNNDQPILSDNFRLYKKKSLVNVFLYSNRIEISGSKSLENHVISLAHVAGTKIGKGHTKSDQNAYLTIYIYSIQTNNSKLSRRKRVVLELECSKFGTNYDQNLQYVNTWHLKLDDLLKQEIFHRFLKTNSSII
jgi:hypothetical protein